MDGIKHGYGTYKWSDDSVYKGNWEMNQFSGDGTFFYTNGNTYQGKWLEDKKHGFGLL